MMFGSTSLRVTLALAACASCVSSASAAQYAAYASYSDSACSSAPKQVAYIISTDCSTSTDTACVADASTGLYIAKSCVADPQARSSTVFGSKPWVQFDVYESGSSCGTRASSVGYLADGSCLAADNGASSIVAKVLSDKSVNVTTYDGTSCSGTPTKTNSIAASDLARTTCLKGLLHAYASSTTTSVSAQSDDADRPALGALGALLLSAAAIVLW